MPGEAFFHRPPDTASYLRLNFSHAEAHEMEKGLAILAELLHR
jgi:DNA-binding transcriptional MocR family regulator